MTNQDQMVREHKHFTMGTGVYRLVGFWAAPSKSVQERNPEAYNLAMASRPKACHFSCDHCGTGIQNHFIIRDSAGKDFCVGSSCIEKLGDTRLVTQAQAMERKRQREIRAEKRRQEQLDRQAKYEAELQAQRDRNGGLTDDELARQQRERALAERKVALYEVMYDITAVLYQAGDFGRSMSLQMQDGDMPTGNARRICIEILAKQHGRKNSKAYEAAYWDYEDRFEALERQVADIKAAHPV